MFENFGIDDYCKASFRNCRLSFHRVKHETYYFKVQIYFVRVWRNEYHAI